MKWMPQIYWHFVGKMAYILVFSYWELVFKGLDNSFEHLCVFQLVYFWNISKEFLQEMNMFPVYWIHFCYRCVTSFFGHKSKTKYPSHSPQKVNVIKWRHNVQYLSILNNTSVQSNLIESRLLELFNVLNRKPRPY